MSEPIDTKTEKKLTLNRLEDFFLICSAADRDTLAQCSSDIQKYVGVGATIFFTGFFASLSSAYALYTIFENWFVAAIFGLFWGLMIFNLDRYIVSSMKSRGSFKGDLGVALPRLVLAILLAFIIAQPLELKVFEKEIVNELEFMQQEKIKEQKDTVLLRYQPQIDELQTSVNQLREEIANKETEYNERSFRAEQEVDGTGGSGVPNPGPIYRIKQANADQALADLEAARSNNLPLISQKEIKIVELQEAVENETSKIEGKKYNGLAARIEALHRLTKKSSAILIAFILIKAVFIALETAPIFVKLISYRGPYDFLLHEKEYAFEVNHLEKTTLHSSHLENKLRIETELEKHRADARLTEEKTNIDSGLQEVENLRAKNEVRKHQIKVRIEEEKAKIDAGFSKKAIQIKAENELEKYRAASKLKEEKARIDAEVEKRTEKIKTKLHTNSQPKTEGDQSSQNIQ